MHNETSYILLFVILLSSLFAYTNGFQDGSTVAASIIGSRTLSPKYAVILISIFEFAGALLGGSAVASTVKSIARFPNSPEVLAWLACGMTAAIGWNFLTKQLGFPSSSTHAMVGGLLGAIVAAGAGTDLIIWGEYRHFVDATGLAKVFVSLFLSPLVGFTAGYLLFKLTMLLLLKASTRVNRWLKLAQLPALAFVSFGHGANDTQKVMGVVVLALSSSGLHLPEIPPWVRVLTAISMILGIISLAPRIVRKVGSNIFRLRPIHGFVTQAAAAAVLIYASATGGPVSASQVISSAVMGVGTAERHKGVHWLVAKEMLIAWFVTIPGAALASAVIYFLLFSTFTKIL
ncbi:MAG: inorganic phosphate transporter [Candidatus Melainabacteria bacterium]|nr:inorganic phosphate transporter [Candidatus Melainabacteria bacterium]